MNEIFSNSPRRNKYELWVEILNLCQQNEVHLSQIMRKLRLTIANCKEYLSFLIQKNLIIVSESATDGFAIYSTSNKGKEAIAQFLNVLAKFFN